MARNRIKLNSGGMREILNGPAMERDMLRRARQAADAARDSAPVESGEYRDSIHAEVVHTDRAVGRVYADAPHALVVEAKTSNLGRSIDAAGD
jgi:hypothetical protein